MTTQTVLEHKVRNGQAYVVSVNKSVGAGGTLNLHLENPEGSGEVAIISNIKVSSPDGKMRVRIPHGFTVDTTGTLDSIENKTIGSSKTTSLSAYQDSTYSGASHTDTTYVGTGTGGAGTVFGGETDDVLGGLLPEGDLIIVAQNPSGSNSRDCSITITYYQTTN